MEIQNRDHYAKVLNYAAAIGMLASLKENLDRLENIATNLGGVLHLGCDFAPYSFTWAVVRDGACVYNGGLIYHGQHDRGGDGGGPTFSVSVEPCDGWQIHS